MTVSTAQARKEHQLVVKDPLGNVTRVINIGDLQVGMPGDKTSLLLTGGFEITTRIVTLDASNPEFQLDREDIVICVNAPSAPTTLRLPLIPNQGKMYIIKDIAGTAATYPIELVPDQNITIDGSASATINDNFGSFIIIYNGTQWVTIARGGSGGIYAPSSAPFITVNNHSGLLNERKALSNTGTITLVDGGANTNISFDLTSGVVSPGTFANATVTVDTYGRVTAISAGSIPSAAGSYVTITNEASLTGERALTPGVGIGLTDNGANSSVVLFIKDNIVATISGAQFSGPVRAQNGLTGSLQEVSPGTPYLLSLGAISLSTNSFGQVTISGSGAGGGTTYTAGEGLSLVGSQFSINVAAGSNITVTSGSGNQVIISSTASGSGGGTVDPNAPIVVTFPTASVPAGRTLTAGSGINIQDNGAGNPVIVSLSTLASQSATAFEGFSTGSISWTSTTWSDFTNIITNFQDVITSGITRSASTFTVNQTGLYNWHSDFNFSVSAGYVGFRLSASNGILLQKTVYAATDAPAGILNGIVQLNSGSTVKLQYVRKTGGNATWGVTDPIDGENMRTGRIAMFRIADPIVINTTSSLAAPISYHDLTHSPVALWQLSGTIGDSSGNGFHLTVGGTERYSELWPGVLGYAFDGSSGLARTANDILLTITGAMTVEFIGRLDQRPTTDAVIFSMDASGESLATNYLYTAYVSANSMAPQYFAENGAGSNIGFTAPFTIPVGEIFHFAMVRGNDSQVRFYINGDPAGSGSVGLGTPAFSGPTQIFRIGTEASVGGSRFIGTIASFKIISGTALTHTQVQAEFARTVAPIFQRGGSLLVVSSSSGGGVTSVTGTWRDPGNTFVTTGSVSIDSQNRTATTVGSDVFFFVSGTISGPTAGKKISVFGGDTFVSGTGVFVTGLSGSLQRLSSNLSYIVAGPNIAVTTASNGQVVIASTATGGATFVTSGSYGTFEVVTGSLTSNVNLSTQPTYTTLVAITSSLTDVEFWAKYSGVVAGANTIWARVTVDGIVQPNRGTYTETVTNTAGFGGSFGGRIVGLSPGSHIFVLEAAKGSGANTPSINPISSPTHEGATLMLQSLTASVAVVVTTGSNRTATDGNDIIVWRLDETSGNTFVNTGTSGSNGDLTGSANVRTGMAGIFDNSIAFIGHMPPSFATASNEIIPNLSNITVSGWIYPFQMYSGSIVIKHSNTSLTFDANSPIHLGLTGSTMQPFIQFRTAGSVTNLLIAATTRSLALNDWNHLAATYDGSTIRLFLNGEVHGTLAATGIIDYSTNGWWAVGGLPTAGANSPDAKLSDIRVSNILRNSEYIKHIYVTGKYGKLGNPATFITGPMGAGAFATGSNLTFTDASVGNSSINLAQLYCPLDVYARRPAPGFLGRRFTCVDSPTLNWIDSGSIWRPLIAGQVMGFEPPLSGNFTAFNQGASTLQQHSGALLFTGVQDGATPTLRGFVLPFSSSTAFIETCMTKQTNSAVTGSTFTIIGIVMRENSTSKSYYLAYGIDHTSVNQYVEAGYFSNDTTRVTQASFNTGFNADSNAPVFIRIRRDASNIFSDISRDRLNWIQVHGVALTTAFTTAPDRVGFGTVGINVLPRVSVLHLLSGSL